MTLCILGCMQVVVFEEGDERTYDMAGAFCSISRLGAGRTGTCISLHLPVSPGISRCKYLPAGRWSH